MKARSAVATLLVALTAVAAAPASAQNVRGTVLDTISGAPVARGFVILLDASGRELVRTLAGTDGHFSLPAPEPGIYRIRSERIGYRVWESQPFVVRSTAVSDLVLRIPALPTPLAAIEVVGETSCGDPTGNVDAGALWEEARKALAAASWTANQQGSVHFLHMFRRRWNARRSRIEWEEIAGEPGSARLPFSAREPDSLAEMGWVVRRGELWEWYGPDANVLLDESFHRTHCFNAVRGEDEFSGMLGLEFEPVPQRDLPDIAGTLWIDEASSELRHIEYRYTDPPDRLRDDRIGGSVVFHPLSSGAWIVERWVIRIGIWDPQRTNIFNPRRRRPTGFSDRGGQVIGLYNMDGDALYQSPETVVIHGTVVDSIRGKPLADERVWIVSTGYETETDEHGQYTIHAILDGDYRLTSGRLDSLGYMAGRAGGTFSPGDTVQMDLAVPSRLTVHRDLCPEIGIPGDTRALVGLVQNSDGSAVDGVWIAAIWNVGVDRSDRRMRRIRTDDTGRYVLCNVPIGADIEVEILLEELDDPVVELIFRGDQVDITQGGVTSTYEVADRILRLDLQVAPDPLRVRR